MTKIELIKFICELYGFKDCPFLIQKQINKQVTEHGYTYKEIARALAFYVEIKKGNVEPKYGIAIVPYVMDEARQYYAKLEQQVNAQKRQAEQTKASNKEQKIIKCDVVKSNGAKRHHIDLNKL